MRMELYNPFDRVLDLVDTSDSYRVMIFDVHSLLRVGGCLRLDHFFGRGMDLDKVCVVDWEIKGTRR